MDPAEQLQRIYLADFDLQTYDRFPQAVAAMKGNCIALLQPSPAGLVMIGVPGWRMGELMGVLTEEKGQKIFQAKQEKIEATAERLEELQRFRDELTALLAPTA